MEVLPLGQQPNAKRRVDIVEPHEQGFHEPRRRHQQGMRVLGFGVAQRVPEIDAEPFAFHFHDELFDLQTVVSGLQKRLAQFMENLAKRRASLLLVELAP